MVAQTQVPVSVDGASSKTDASASLLKDDIFLAIHNAFLLRFPLPHSLKVYHMHETPYEALHVADGFQALKVVKSLKPSLFLLDYNLPGMTGIELYDQLHALEDFQDVPTILFTAHTRAKHEAKEREITWIGKPFELAELLQAIENQLA